MKLEMRDKLSDVLLVFAVAAGTLEMALALLLTAIYGAG